MANLERKIMYVLNSIKNSAYDYRNGKCSKYVRDYHIKQVKKGLLWLKQLDPSNNLLKEDFTDIK